jgi:hypothetical protein
MKARVLRLFLAAVCILGIVQAAAGHENQTFRIGKQVYKLTVGSLNEPVAVDDKTGLDFKVEIEPGPGAKAGPVAGLEQTLKVEVAAGDKKKVFNLQPSFGTPGTYKTNFYPTVQTTLSYRIFGTIEDVPVNFTFTCSPAGHARVPEDTTEDKISDQVTRLSKRGSFGCPVAKADVGFPEPAPSAFELQKKIDSMDSSLAGAQSQAGTARLLGVAGLVVGIAGFAVAMAAFMKGRSNGKNVQSNAPRRKM